MNLQETKSFAESYIKKTNKGYVDVSIHKVSTDPENIYESISFHRAEMKKGEEIGIGKLLQFDVELGIKARYKENIKKIIDFFPKAFEGAYNTKKLNPSEWVKV